MLILAAVLVAVFLLAVFWRVSESRRRATASESGGPGLLGLFAMFTPAGPAIAGAKALKKV